MINHLNPVKNNNQKIVMRFSQEIGVGEPLTDKDYSFPAMEKLEWMIEKEPKSLTSLTMISLRMNYYCHYF
jgi:hypothetical protein